MAPGTGYTLHVTTTYDDSHTSEWTYDHPGGDAEAAHDQLAQRWRAAGWDHTRDRQRLMLTRHVTGKPEIGPYTDTIRHIPWEPQ